MPETAKMQDVENTPDEEDTEIRNISPRDIFIALINQFTDEGVVDLGENILICYKKYEFHYDEDVPLEERRYDIMISINIQGQLEVFSLDSKMESVRLLKKSTFRVNKEEHEIGEVLPLCELKGGESFEFPITPGAETTQGVKLNTVRTSIDSGFYREANIFNLKTFDVDYLDPSTKVRLIEAEIFSPSFVEAPSDDEMVNFEQELEAERAER